MYEVAQNYLIVQLKGSQVLSSFRKLTLLHPLPNVPQMKPIVLSTEQQTILPMNKSSLSIHQVKLVVKPVDWGFKIWL